MSGSAGSYQVVSAAGKTICAMRHTFCADETFEMVAALLKKRCSNIKFISNHDMPDAAPASPAQEAEPIKVLRQKRCDVLLAGNVGSL